jgi:dihydroorotate dehydrogenase (NAD+) catalytic subunit
MGERVTRSDLSIDLGFCRLKNPVIAASGTFGYGTEFRPFLDLNGLGGFVVKGLYSQPKPGNPPPRLVETASGLINAIGLQGIGVQGFCREILPQLQDLDTAVLVNVCGSREEEYAEVVEYLDRFEGIAAYELNVSCPNVAAGGSCPALDPEATHRIVSQVKRSSRRPLITKLSPNTGKIVEVALAAEDAGSDALSLVNTFLALAVDPDTRRPKLANVMGGLSGPAIKPLALRMVYQVAREVNIPVIGMGGITTAEDVLEYMIAGASAVEVGTANFVDPETIPRIVAGLKSYCQAHNIERLANLTGTLAV